MYVEVYCNPTLFTTPEKPKTEEFRKTKEDKEGSIRHQTKSDQNTVSTVIQDR
jgi:hypothetical protein